MIAGTITLRLSTLMLAAAAGTVGLPLGIAQAGIVAATDKATATDDRVVFRLIDEQGRPVAGAKVSRNVGLDDPQLHGKQLDWSKAATSDENGRVVLPKWDIFAYWSDKTSPYILHEERRIGAAPEIPNNCTGERPPIVLTPVCRVHGMLSDANVPTADIPLTWMQIVICAGDTSNWMLHGGFRAREEQDFNLLLPPGRYSLTVYALEDAGRKGTFISNKVRRERRIITVTPGQQSLELGVISLRPARVWSLIGQPAPEIGPMKAWKNGSPVTLADLRGEVVWLHFGGKTPMPFLDLPVLTRLHKAFGDKGLTIIAIYNCDSMEELDRLWAQAYERDKWVEAHGKGPGVREAPFRIAVDGGESTFYGGTNQERPGATYGRYDVDLGWTDVLIDRAGNIVRMPDSRDVNDVLSEMLGLPVEKPRPAVWQQPFCELYRLEDGQVLKHIAPPFIPERAEYFKDRLKDLDLTAPFDFMIPSRAIFRWDGKLTQIGGSHGKSSADLQSVIQYVCHLRETEYEGPQDLLHLELPGDWIVRADASLEAAFLALEGIIASELGRRIRFERRLAVWYVIEQSDG